MSVLKEDVLGEGEGAWDSDPRYPADVVNCIIWLQLVVSEVYGYGMELEEKIKIMDRIRYYGGYAAYGLRKCHYIDLWLKVEPEPFQRIKLSEFSGYRCSSIEVDKKKFKEFHNYPCELYYEDVTTFTTEYVTAEGLVECVDKLAPGYYVGFPVASPYYLSLYGKNGGPLALVHSFVLNVKSPGDAPQAPGAQSERAIVHHASTLQAAVCTKTLPEYLNDSKKVFVGYTLFELDPHWDFRAPKEENEVMKRIRQCEAALPRNQINREL